MATTASWPPVSHRADLGDLRIAIADLRLKCTDAILPFNRRFQIENRKLFRMASQPQAELVKALVDAGVHFGHRVSRWNPKMQPYIHGKRNMIHLIDVRETMKG